MTQISISNVAVEFGATTLLSDVTFTVGRRERWGIIGRNGSGKTTLFRLITGAMQPTRGVVSRQPGLRITLLEQHRDFGSATTVWDAAAQPFHALAALEHSLAEQVARLAEVGEKATDAMLAKYDRDLERFAREGGYEMDARIDAVLQGLAFDPAAARTQLLEHLSGGERGRLGLARQLVAPADVLLLDEPTNHLDLETAAWLEGYLRDIDETVILISHDRAFLERVADHILHVENGTTYSYTGGYSAFIQQRAERQLAQQRQFDQQRRTIAKEEDYIRRNIAGQNTKQAKGRRTRLERMPRLTPPPGEDGAMLLRLASGERGGDQVVVAEHLGIAIGERVLVRGFSAIASRGDIIGLVGPNGAGKSTLLRTLMAEREPAAGAIRLGGSITPAYYEQDLAQVPLGGTLYEVIQELRPMWGRGPIQSHLGAFDFSGDSVQRSTTTLSGGERARLALAMIVLSKANLLLLDEPTNHLDVESIEALEDAIEEYDGTVILVSHDRALLRELVTRVWALDGERITDFPGPFVEWESRRAEAAEAASRRAAEEEQARRASARTEAKRGAEGQKGERSARRERRRAVDDAERDVARAEAKVKELTAELEHPDLYAKPDGGKRARALQGDLAAARRAHDAALERWATATEAAEATSRG